MKSKTSINTNDNTVVMYVDGFKYKVTVEVSYNDFGMPEAAKVNLDRTDEPLTIGNKGEMYFKFGGFPEFMQGVFEPCAEDGRPYTYICTVNNDWGDCGNANIFVLLKHQIGIYGFTGDVVVEDVYVEASCS